MDLKLTRYIRNPPTRINQPHLHPDKLNGVLWIGVDPEVHEFIKATWQGNFWGPWQSWLKQQYYWEDGFHEEIFFKWKLQTQVIICGRISQKRQKNKQPSYVSATVWETILANWSTAEAKAKSQSVNLVVVEEGLERPVSYPDLVRKTHCRKDGTFLDERAEALVLEVEQAVEEMLQDGSPLGDSQTDVDRHAWAPFMQQYYWEDQFHEEIYFKWKLQTQVTICGRISQKRQKNKQPSYVSATDWETILANWSTAEAKAKSQSAAESRCAAPPGLKMHVHGAGPRTFANIAYNMVVEEGLEGPVSYPDLVRKTHCRKDGTFLDERAEALVLEVEQAVEEMLLDGSPLGDSQTESTAATRTSKRLLLNEEYIKRGQTRRGTIYGLGNLQYKNKRPSKSVPAALNREINMETRVSGQETLTQESASAAQASQSQHHSPSHSSAPPQDQAQPEGHGQAPTPTHDQPQAPGLDVAVYVLWFHVLNLSNVLLSMSGSTARSIQSKWLRKHGIATVEASDWNELTQIIRDLFETGSRENSFDSQHTIAESLRAELSNIQEIRNPVFVIVVDIGVLDLTTDIWKEQLNYLDRFSSKAKFAWLLKHDTSNTVKTELRRKGHVMMVNKPLYKAKMIQILEAVIKNRRRGLRGNGSDDSHDCLEIDPTQFDTCSSDDSSDTSVKPTVLPSPVLKNYLLDITKSNDESTSMTQKKQEEEEDWKDRSNRLYSGVALDGKNQKSLEGVRILLAEDTPVLQRVATIMLEKMGATVTAVWDGQQAVDALNYKSINAQEHNNLSEEEETNPQSDLPNSSPYDLILMDCQSEMKKGIIEEKAKTVPFYKLFSFSDSTDVLLMIVGSIGAIGNGLGFPLMTLLFGDLIDTVGRNLFTNDIVELISKICLKFVYLGLGTFVAAFLQVSCWVITGERQAARIRSLYLKTILRQDIVFFDVETNTGEVVGRMSGDTVLILDAMGEKVGKFIQLFVTFLGGYALAFVKGWLLTLVMLTSIPLLAMAGAATSLIFTKASSQQQAAYAKASTIAEQTCGLL
ncbi:hypothetical protein F2Q68_00033726 [Brassica cretica]|uniref:Response regulatory domain-containing protein n=1 Tax=Brassica cretica TaxID=69181 RepID=A0A8S9H5E8_BRACR|nr:hypothetical protein F2Q68_00033726 [Brassica cretica]